MHENYQALEPVHANFVPLSPLSFLKRTAGIFPDREAVVYGDRRYSWSQLYDRCRALAASLQARGIGLGDTVSVIAPNIPELFELHYAVPMTGAVLNTINMRLEAQTIAYILDHSDCKLVIADSAFAALLGEAMNILGRTLPVIDICDDQAETGDGFGDDDYETLVKHANPSFDWQLPESEWQALALNYTSGTSGRPKGVVYHHRGAYLMAMGTVSAWQVPQHPVYLSVVPMFHCNGWNHPWAMTIVAAKMIFIRDAAPQKVFAAIKDYNVTHFGGAPIVLSMLAEAPQAPKQKISPPVKVMTAGAPPPAVILEKTSAMGLEVMQVYGLTETYGHISQCLWRDEWNDLSASEQAEMQAMQGVAFPMVEDVAIIDRSTGKPVANNGGVQGEIAIRGNTVMKGYYKDTDATIEAFQDGWFWSGDGAVVHENGYMEIRDRLKDVIISGGENISSVEVESVLYRHPAVQAAAVVAKPDEKWGEVPCAFVELKPGAKATGDEIMAFCKQHMAGFKRPKHVVFGDLPKTATGKIQKFQLREMVKSC